MILQMDYMPILNFILSFSLAIFGFLGTFFNYKYSVKNLKLTRNAKESSYIKSYIDDFREEAINYLNALNFILNFENKNQMHKYLDNLIIYHHRILLRLNTNKEIEKSFEKELIKLTTNARMYIYLTIQKNNLSILENIFNNKDSYINLKDLKLYYEVLEKNKKGCLDEELYNKFYELLKQKFNYIITMNKDGIIDFFREYIEDKTHYINKLMNDRKF